MRIVKPETELEKELLAALGEKVLEIRRLEKILQDQSRLMMKGRQTEEAEAFLDVRSRL